MKKNLKITLIIILLVSILLIILFARQKTEETIVPTPPPTKEPEELILRDAFPVDEVMLSDSEEEQLRLITELKNLTPITTPDFSIEYSYKTGGFIVKSDIGLSATEKALEIWLNEKGFGDIKSERFEYQSNKLSL
jgi:hypothetical protein